MKVHTSDFKNAIKEFGREIDNIITYTINSEELELSEDTLNSVTPHYEGAILKSIMKQLDIDSNVEIPVGTIINYQFGIKVADEVVEYYRDNYEYINFGNYVVKEVEKQEDTNSYLIKCCDIMLYSMVDYEALNITYPITIDNYIKAICDKLGYTFKNYQTQYANYDKEITNELYLTYNDASETWESLDYTFRDVLDELAQVTASTICINEDDDELEIRYINNTNDTIDEEYLKDINVNFGQKYGPINTIVLSRSAGSDKIYKSYPENLPEEQRFAVEIADNQIMNDNDRDLFIDDILNQLKGLEYYLNDFSSTGVGYYNLCDKYNISVTLHDEESLTDTTTIYPCIMFNDEFSVTQGDIQELIHTDEPKETDTEYKYADTTDKRLNRASLIVDKQNQKIVATIETIQNDLEDNYTTISKVEEMIVDAETGITNTLIKAGGNNLIRNSALLFKDTEGNYEYWEGDIDRGVGDEYDVISETNTVILTQTNGVKQSINVVPDFYTLSFKYKRVLLTSDITFLVNQNAITFEDLTEGEITYTFKNDNNNITLEFNSSIDNGYIIYDLMLNKGNVALDYSQNANETTTDTVKIGKGIAVTSETTDTITRIDSDGFRVLNKNNEDDILLRATDTGTDTKTLEVREWAEISGIRIQETNSQTWITGII